MLLAALLLATPHTLPPVQCTKLLAAARAMVGQPIEYEPAYVRISYPNGDVPANTGVCADVVVRSFRALGIDLQKLVHEDMAKSFRAYPAKWGLHKPDANIDHRRVPNLMKFLERRGKSLPLDKDFQPCDVVAWDLGGGLTHVGLVTDRGTIVHHIGGRPAEEDVLRSWKIIGHFAW